MTGLAASILDQAARAAARIPRETGLLFTGAMARSAHRGDKTQTRRTRGLDILNAAPDEWTFDRWQDGYPDGRVRAVFYQHGGEPIGLLCPYGQSGDLIYAKETWAVAALYDALAPSALNFGAGGVKVHYLADGEKPPGFGKTRVSIHMPRAAARTIGRLTEVRVQRLRQISEADAVAEGVSAIPPTPGWSIFRDDGSGAWWGGDEPVRGQHGVRDYVPSNLHDGYTAAQNFERLWCSINGPASWAANPWAWALSFFLVRPPAPRKES